jgi:hypothetical protein
VPHIFVRRQSWANTAGHKSFSRRGLRYTKSRETRAYYRLQAAFNRAPGADAAAELMHQFDSKRPIHPERSTSLRASPDGNA